jgi:membrane-bound serine protease (ClpP class)
VILLGAILLAFFVLPLEWAIPVIVVGAMVEVGETFFWLWYSRRRGAQVGAETLIGELAEVVTRCAPLGQVRLQGELWRARCDEVAERGEHVRVKALEDLTLVVERTPSSH